MILCDTSAWIDYLRGTDSEIRFQVRHALRHGRIIVGDLILVEVLQGIRLDAQRRDVVEIMANCRNETLCGTEMAHAAADNYRTLRRRGITVRGTIDVIIASWCIRHKVTLLHNDRDFTAMEAALGLNRY
ncbi:ribonuclease VapC11 [Aureimonas sp. SA4125]|uniref:type II toxin-antitoxin system VapC family toxin n=1 Tax=Aureimonas sp. SA4125 TaxID=2826993 RepID=UPI001CC3EF4B|nr:PIN domain-containing protein [Aureimonas sp. SA4125]BDA83774.1 ribonuclease VapC11 [Aureimonas sp. SA4125]